MRVTDHCGACVWQTTQAVVVSFAVPTPATSLNHTDTGPAYLFTAKRPHSICCVPFLIYSCTPTHPSIWVFPVMIETSDPCRFGSPAACATGSVCSHFFSMLHATPPHSSADSALSHQTQAGRGRFRYVRNRANCGALPLTRPGCLLLAFPPHTHCSFF